MRDPDYRALLGANSFIGPTSGEFQIIVSELPTFRRGLCYLMNINSLLPPKEHIEIQARYDSSRVHLNKMNLYLTGRYDFLILVHDSKGGLDPFKISARFGDDYFQSINFQELVTFPLDCNKSDISYHSCQNYFVDTFMNTEYKQCANQKCIPFQMEGFRYNRVPTFSQKFKSCTFYFPILRSND